MSHSEQGGFCLGTYHTMLQAMAQAQDAAFVIRPGASAVFLSAPHSFEHVREGQIRAAEPGAGALAAMLGDELGCPFAYTTNCDEDPNWDPHSQYRDRVHAAVQEGGCKFLIDLHQLNPARTVDIDLGTAGGANLVGRDWVVEAMTNEFVAQGFAQVLIDEPFAAKNPRTMAASTALACGIPSVQVEINSRYLAPGYADFAPWRVYAALERIIRRLDEEVAR